MTKEEAIYKAKHLRKVHPSICVDAEDFWDTVIAALEQEPCEDAISLEAVKNTMFMVQRTAFISDNEFHRTMDLLMRLPSVTPAERVGRWKPYDGSWYECSECGATREAVGYFENYCPNCGAKMASPTSCSTCILDRTDACTRGAGRAVDDEACEDYLASPTGAEGSEE